MPPITFHMVFAGILADGLGEPSLTPDSGPFLLGATTPDIRAITHQDRRETHFFDLDGPDHQDSVAGFFAEHGQLAAPDRLDDATRAWVCGYISHLVLDEQYITGVYRPFFADPAPLGGRLRASVMDRLLQFELDRTFAGAPAVRNRLQAALAVSVAGIQSGFIDGATLDRWRVISQEVVARSSDWDRIREMITHHVRHSDLVERDALATFLDSLPELLNATITHVPSAEVDGFLQRSTDAATKAIERYLECG